MRLRYGFVWIAALTLLFGFATLSFADITENFDSLSQSSYGNYDFHGFHLQNSLCYSDKAYSGNSVRLRNSSTFGIPYLEYRGLVDTLGKDGGVGTISFLYRDWNNSATVDDVLVNVNNGGWTAVGNRISVSDTSAGYQPWTYDLNNPADNIRIRVEHESGERLLIDNFSITDFTSGQDTTRPTLSTVTVVSNTTIDVSFSEPIDSATASHTANYSVDLGVGHPISAARQPSLSVVRLVFGAPMNPNTYTLTVSNVTDLSANPILPGSQIQFTVINAPNSQIVFTEVMPDPNFGGLADSLGEWFEVYNRTNSAIDLNGWIIGDAQGSDTIVGPASIAAGQYFVFCSNGDSATNGGVPENYAYHYVGGGRGLALNNTGETLTLKEADGTLVSTLNYTGKPFAAGLSTQLRDVDWDSAVDSNWCVADTAWPGANNGDAGTPGSATVCGVVPPPAGLSLCELRSQDACGNPTYFHENVLTHGIVTWADTCRGNTYIQSGGCGVLIFGDATRGIMGGSDRTMLPGDSVAVQGYITQFRGLTEFSTYLNLVPAVTFISTGHPLPAPAEITCGIIGMNADTCVGEAYESRLVRIRNVSFVDGNGVNTFPDADSNYTVTCDNDSFLFRVSHCDSITGQVIPTGAVTITGVMGQFDQSSCLCSGYQIQIATHDPFVEVPNQCADPIALTARRSTANPEIIQLRWQPGDNQICNHYSIYWTADPNVIYPTNFTFLTSVCGVTSYDDNVPISTNARRYYHVVADGVCP